MTVEGTFLGITTVDIQFILSSDLVQNRNNHVNSVITDIGGMATNAAITFQMLGGKSTLVSHVGLSDFSNLILNKFKKYGLKHIDLSQNKKKKPTISTIITHPNGERTILTKYVDQLSDSYFSIPSSANIILADNSNSFILTKLTKINSTIPIVLDIDDLCFDDELKFNRNSIIIASENGYLKLNGKIKEFMSRYTINKLVFTRGEKPILYYTKNEIGEIPIERINSIDTLGAGDIFHGAFCYYYLKNNSFKSSIINASKVASISCKFIGTREWINHI
jgi:sugar/nucleoside kinase (ribokinase family)